MDETNCNSEFFNIDLERFSNVGFIKIDVEGHEHAVLEGATKTIKRNMPNLLVEMEEKHNKIPINEMISGASIALAALLLIIPGFFTDFLGILLLLPPLRIMLIKSFVRKAASRFARTSQSSNKNKDYIDIDPDN